MADKWSLRQIKSASLFGEDICSGSIAFRREVALYMVLSRMARAACEKKRRFAGGVRGLSGKELR